MSKRVPAFDLSSITAETAEPMREGAQRAAMPAVIAPSATSSAPNQQARQDSVATKTALLVPLSFKVAPEFRKRFRQRALEADLRLNELLFEALDAWEEKRRGR